MYESGENKVNNLKCGWESTRYFNIFMTFNVCVGNITVDFLKWIAHFALGR